MQERNKLHSERDKEVYLVAKRLGLFANLDPKGGLIKYMMKAKIPAMRWDLF